MTLTVYFDGDEQVLKVDGKVRSFSTACDIRNLMREAYTAGLFKQGFTADIQMQSCLNTPNMK